MSNLQVYRVDKVDWYQWQGGWVNGDVHGVYSVQVHVDRPDRLDWLLKPENISEPQYGPGAMAVPQKAIITYFEPYQPYFVGHSDMKTYNHDDSYWNPTLRCYPYYVLYTPFAVVSPYNVKAYEATLAGGMGQKFFEQDVILGPSEVPWAYSGDVNIQHSAGNIKIVNLAITSMGGLTPCPTLDLIWGYHGYPGSTGITGDITTFESELKTASNWGEKLGDWWKTGGETDLNRVDWTTFQGWLGKIFSSNNNFKTGTYKDYIGYGGNYHSFEFVYQTDGSGGYWNPKVSNPSCSKAGVYFPGYVQNMNFAYEGDGGLAHEGTFVSQPYKYWLASAEGYKFAGDIVVYGDADVFDTVIWMPPNGVPEITSVSDLVFTDRQTGYIQVSFRNKGTTPDKFYVSVSVPSGIIITGQTGTEVLLKPGESATATWTFTSSLGNTNDWTASGTVTVDSTGGRDSKVFNITVRPATVPPPPGPSLGFVKVMVVDAENHEPIPDALCSIEGTSVSGVTDSGGVAILTNIPEGEYKLTVTKPGYNKWSKKITVVGGQTTEVLVQLEKTPSKAGFNYLPWLIMGAMGAVMAGSAVAIYRMRGIEWGV
jgi:hypothetical protein